MKNVLFFIAIILISIFNACSDNPTGNEDINHPPQITSLVSNPDTIETGATSALTCNANDSDGDNLTFVWDTGSGAINGSGSSVNWVSPNTAGAYYVRCKVVDGNGGEDMDSIKIVVTASWKITSFPGDLYGNWFSDYDGSWQWDISGSTTIRTFNRFFTVHSTYGLSGAEYEYKVITREGGRWYTFFYKNVTANHMQATFPGCPSSPTGFDTESEALEANSVYNQFCNGNHR